MNCNSNNNNNNTNIYADGPAAAPLPRNYGNAPATVSHVS